MLGQNVENWQSEVQRMVDIGCEIGSHSWDHLNLYDLDMDAVAKEFSDTDAALEKACGQKASVARAPYGNWSDDIIATVQKPFFTWSLDSLDWSYMDVDKDYNEIMNGDLTDGSIILMHDIHEPSVQAAIKMIPELVQKGYKLMTVSELAAAKGVTYRMQTILISGTVHFRRVSLQDITVVLLTEAVMVQRYQMVLPQMTAQQIVLM